jgi:dipeptide/tripeptide permease
MHEIIAGLSISIAGIVFFGAALVAGTWGWPHPWLSGFGASGLALLIGFLCALLVHRD